jgi:NADPH:quinone reductase-like Zn-dependent oxidoreductase
VVSSSAFVSSRLFRGIATPSTSSFLHSSFFILFFFIIFFFSLVLSNPALNSSPSFFCILNFPVTPVLLRVHASSVNPVDYKLLEAGSGLPIRFPHVLGFDVAGTVAAVGEEIGRVTSGANGGRLKVGDAVWADLGKMELLRGGELGAWAEYALADASQVGLKPASLNFSAAASLPLVGLTALQAFRKMGGKGAFVNKTVVVTSGSGGTGFVAIQMARLYGAKRIITATSAPNMAFVKSLGATEVINYHERTLWSALGNGTVDLVYDNFGAPGTADAAMPSLRAPGGVFLFLPGRDGALSKHPKRGVRQINYGLTDASKYADLDELRALVDTADGDGLRSHIQETFPLADAVRALNVSMGGKVVGKLGICVVAPCDASRVPSSMAVGKKKKEKEKEKKETRIRGENSGDHDDVDATITTVKSGDLVFVQPPLNSQSPFDAAILATGLATVQWMRTHGVDRKGAPANATATHVAMAWRSGNGSLHYVQALPRVGVVVTSEDDFMHELPPGTILYRSRVIVDGATSAAAAAVAHSLRGRAYASDFEPPSSGRFYCSSLVEHAFRKAANTSANATHAGVFLHRPFTLIFKPLRFWEAYYDKLGRVLPVNRTGSNPTLLLHSQAVAVDVGML